MRYLRLINNTLYILYMVRVVVGIVVGRIELVELREKVK